MGLNDELERTRLKPKLKATTTETNHGGGGADNNKKIGTARHVQLLSHARFHTDSAEAIIMSSVHGEPSEGMCCLCTMEDITKEDGNYCRSAHCLLIACVLMLMWNVLLVDI
jgi:hypothetical protein